MTQNVIETFHIGGAQGNNKIKVVGTELDDVARISDDDGKFTSSDYKVYTYSFSETTFDGNGGDDKAQLYGTLGDDQLDARAGDANLDKDEKGVAKVTLTSSNFVLRAMNFDRVDSYGRGGKDTASLYGSLESDYFFSRDNYTVMKGAGVTHYTKDFERVNAYGRAGYDSAKLYDSVENDSFVALPTYAYLTNGEKTSYAKGFERVSSFSNEGGHDKAVFFDDSSKDDKFVTRAAYSYMSNESFLNYAAGFDEVEAKASGGDDVATTSGISQGDSVKAVDDLFMVMGQNGYRKSIGFSKNVAEEKDDSLPANYDFVRYHSIDPSALDYVLETRMR